jgi:predicted aminopeptidase
MPSGDYYFNNIDVSNSSRIRFKINGGVPIRIFVLNRVDLSNSSSFEYYINGAQVFGNEAAPYIYLEPKTGMTCANSVQWKGFVYSPHGSINFVNSSSIAGAVLSWTTVNLANSTTVSYVQPFHQGTTTLMPSRFYQ